jgi:hypothetical protein
VLGDALHEELLEFRNWPSGIGPAHGEVTGAALRLELGLVRSPNLGEV